MPRPSVLSAPRTPRWVRLHLQSTPLLAKLDQSLQRSKAPHASPAMQESCRSYDLRSIRDGKLTLPSGNNLIQRDWIKAMAFQINRYCFDGFHRWFDSGDLQSVEMLDAICQVAKATPQIKHWLPTQERGMVKQYSKAIPDNLIIRVSASMVNGDKPSFDHASQVFYKVDPKGYECGASKRGNACGPCKACWDKSIDFISYPKH